MIEVKIPQEIGQYEVKMVGPFTFRQAICAVSIGVIAYFTYNGLHSVLPREVLFGMIFLMACPFGLVGWVKPYGMHFEKFIFGWLFNNLISSAKRVFLTKDVLSSCIPVKKEKKKKPSKIRKKYQKYTYE